MLKLLRNIFGKESVKTIKKISLQELEEYLQSHLRGNHRTEMINVFLRQLDATCAEILAKCVALEQAALQNENLPARVLTIMEGNRTAYLKRTRQFTNEVTAHAAALHALDTSAKMSEHLTRAPLLFEEYGKQTMKPYFVLKEFFANDVYKIAAAVKKLEGFFGQFVSDIEKSPLMQYEKISELLMRVKSRIAKKKEIAESKARFMEQILAEDTQLAELKRQLDLVSASSGYAELEKKKEELVQVQAQQKKMQDGAFAKMAPLSRALRKFEKVTLNVKPVQFLISNPLHALEELPLGVLRETFENLLESVVRGSLELKENVQKENRAILDELLKTWLAEYKHSFSAGTQKILELSSAIKNHPAQKEYDTITERMTQYQLQRALREENLRRLEGELAALAEDDSSRALAAAVGPLGFELGF